MALAISTSIPLREWENEDPRVIATAWRLLEEENDKNRSERGKASPGAGGPQYSG